MFENLSLSEKIVVVCFVMIVLISFSGCRQDPKNPPRYYESELRAMQKQADEEAQNRAQKKILSDTYPWEGKKPKKQPLPCRIYTTEQTLSQEIDCLYEFIHGKKPPKPRLRD
jgi:hypothetical protein